MLAPRPWPLTSNFDLPSWTTHRACWEAPGRQIAVSDRGVVHRRADSRTLTQHASTESHCCLDNGSMAGGTRTTENSKRHVTGRLRHRLRRFRSQTASVISVQLLIRLRLLLLSSTTIMHNELRLCVCGLQAERALRVATSCRTVLSDVPLAAEFRLPLLTFAHYHRHTSSSMCGGRIIPLSNHKNDNPNNPNSGRTTLTSRSPQPNSMRSAAPPPLTDP